MVRVIIAVALFIGSIFLQISLRSYILLFTLFPVKSTVATNN